MNERPQRKTDKLLVGGLSVTDVRYFITICTKDKVDGLTGNQQISEAILNTWRRLHADKGIYFYCGTIMPNHVHILFRLGSRLELSKMIIKFKALTKSALSESNLSWQRNFYDHRLRADTALETFSKYIYLNSYRKGLINVNETYPHWHLNRAYASEFLQHLNSASGPPPAWIQQSIQLTEVIENDVGASFMKPANPQESTELTKP
ncbi:MAG TPA: hypothetical protein DCX06_07790 [Opitutae bacterium]|nr:hypothetical protein [Opitutae bacterium]